MKDHLIYYQKQEELKLRMEQQLVCPCLFSVIVFVCTEEEATSLFQFSLTTYILIHLNTDKLLECYLAYAGI